jgi:hypothetical protein
MYVVIVPTYGAVEFYQSFFKVEGACLSFLVHSWLTLLVFNYLLQQRLL